MGRRLRMKNKGAEEDKETKVSGKKRKRRTRRFLPSSCGKMVTGITT
jgi:hypothetical protein